MFLEALPKNSISETCILFPDPWPKFKHELSQFNPLNLNIEIIKKKQSNSSQCRKISLSGSKKWDNKINNLHNLLDL